MRAFWVPQGEGSPLIRNHVTGKRAVSFSGVSQGVAAHGHALNFITGQVDTGEVIDISGSGITIALRLRLPSSSTRRLFGNHENSSTGYLLYQNGLTIGCYLNNALVTHSPNLVAGSWAQVAFSCAGGGRLVALDGAMTFASGGVSVSGTGTSVRLGAYNWPGHPDFNGDIEYAALWDRGLSAAELLAFQEHPYRLFKAPKAWVFTHAGLHELAIPSLNVLNATSTGAIAQAHALASFGNAQSNTSNSAGVEVGAVHGLAGALMAQANTSSLGKIAQVHGLGAASSIQASAVAGIAAGQAHILAGNAITQANQGNAGAVTSGHGYLAPASFVQANAGLAGAISQAHMLAIPLSLQENRASAGSTADGATVEPALISGTATRVRMRKPSIPPGTPEWLKTMIEILTGRRGNRISMPVFRALTFSGTPTKAECEALYSYMNEVREAVEKIVTRLDS